MFALRLLLYLISHYHHSKLKVAKRPINIDCMSTCPCIAFHHEVGTNPGHLTGLVSLPQWPGRRLWCSAPCPQVGVELPLTWNGEENKRARQIVLKKLFRSQQYTLLHCQAIVSIIGSFENLCRSMINDHLLHHSLYFGISNTSVCKLWS